MIYLIKLSWPAQPLWQNHTCHWTKRSAAKKAHRLEAKQACKSHFVEPDETAILEFDFFPPDRRRRDLHNMPATMKAAIDGIADAMGVDDEKFRCRWPEYFKEPQKGGCVLIQIKTRGNA